MATTVIHRLTLDPMGKCSNAFFSETTNIIKAKLYMNVHWMVLYKLYVFCSDMKFKMAATLVVHRSSETSTNQSDVIIRSDDRFLNLVVNSDSIVSKIYMLNFVLWLFFFSLHTDKHLAVLSKRTFDTQWIHIFGLVYYLSISQNSPFYIRCYYTHGKRSFVLF